MIKAHTVLQLEKRGQFQQSRSQTCRCPPREGVGVAFGVGSQELRDIWPAFIILSNRKIGPGDDCGRIRRLVNVADHDGHGRLAGGAVLVRDGQGDIDGGRFFVVKAYASSARASQRPPTSSVLMTKRSSEVVTLEASSV